MSDFYSKNDMRNYLCHHGIKGQRWGITHGPPYPLTDKMHDRIVKRKAKKAEQRRQKILHDPKKLAKHAPEFTKEEIDNAVAKIDSINQAKKRVPMTKRELKKEAKRQAKIKAQNDKIMAAQKAKFDKALTKKMEKYGTNALVLQANADKFTSAELREALNRVQTKEQIFQTKMNEINRPKKILDTGLGYINTAINALDTFKKLKRAITPEYDEDGYSAADRRRMQKWDKFEKTGNYRWLFGDDKLFDLAKKNSDLQKQKDKDKNKETVEKQGATIEEQKETIRKQEEEIKAYRSRDNYHYNEEREEYYSQFGQQMAVATAGATSYNSVDDLMGEQLLNDYTYMLQMGHETNVRHSNIEELFSVRFSDIM